MASKFDYAVAFTLSPAIEGGYQCDPKDRGNWTTGIIGQGELKGTNFGLSAMSYPKLNIKGLSRDQAIEIYRKDYWNAAGCDSLELHLAVSVFDAAVNSGVSKAKSWLEESDTAQEFNEKRRMFLQNLKNARYRTGWLNRMNSLEKYLSTI